MNDPFPLGSDVIIWVRPKDKLIVLLGEGKYDGLNLINGGYYPVVKFYDGREITIHQSGISVGEAKAVAITCNKFKKDKGTIVEFDLNRWVNGERPEEVKVETPSNLSTLSTTNAAPSNSGEAKTATDKLLMLKQEITYEESKKKMFQQSIDECDKAILAKRTVMASIKDTVMKELAEIENIVVPETMKTEVVKAQPVVRQAVVEVPQDTLDDEAKRNAMED